jgi:plasmid stabilization system protein ParE
MPRNNPLKTAEDALAAAHARRADIRQRRRTLHAEGPAIADAIRAALLEAGRTGTEPAGIGEMRAQLVGVQNQLDDLEHVEQGSDLAIQEAENDVQAARFHAAPALQKQLEERAATLATELAGLEAALVQVGDDEQDLRAGWRQLCAAIPGADDPPFADGVHVPARKPCDAHTGLVAFVPQQDWPGWFRQARIDAIEEFGSDEQREAAGLPARRHGVPRLQEANV